MALSNQDRLFFLVLALLTFSTIYLLSPILSPFLVGILLAYLANPLVNQLMRLQLSRTLSVIVVFLALAILLFISVIILLPFIEKQINLLIESIPSMIDWFQDIALPWLSTNLHIDPANFDIESVKSLAMKNWSKAGGITALLVQSAFQSGAKILSYLANLLLIPTVAFYFLCDWYMILHKGRDLLPKNVKPTVTKLIKECDEVLSQFLRGQLMVVLSFSIIYGTGLSLIGLKMGLLIGIISGLLCIVPYLGFIVGIVIASITAYMQFATFTSVALVLALFVGAQTLDNFYLTPRLVGNRIGLHPIAAIFAILSGSCLFGFVGALLALPTAAVIMIWARYWHHQLVT